MGVALMHHRALNTGNKLPEYTYTGSSQLIDDGDGNWRIKFLTSGTLTFKRALKNIDIFLVGGGASGVAGGYGGYDGEYYGPGGGGGYTKTAKNVAPSGTSYSIVVGAGGNNSDGGTSSAFGYSAAGGKRGTISGIYFDSGEQGHFCYGGCGGSAGGSRYSVTDSTSYSDYSNYISGMQSKGGSNGSSTANYSTYAKGQGTTTREFGEASGALYAGGGGCGGSSGGDGGGGAGGFGSNRPGSSGTANTGGGGGGAPYMVNSYGTGGSGIVVIRNAR